MCVPVRGTCNNKPMFVFVLTTETLQRAVIGTYLALIDNTEPIRSFLCGQTMFWFKQSFVSANNFIDPYKVNCACLARWGVCGCVCMENRDLWAGKSWLAAAEDHTSSGLLSKQKAPSRFAVTDRLSAKPQRTQDMWPAGSKGKGRLSFFAGSRTLLIF